MKLLQINEYLRSELVRAGFAGVDLQKTPLGVRITLKTSRPGLVIGKGGKRIQEITDVLKDRFQLELPQIEVEEVQHPDVNAQIMAERLAYSLDRGRHYRRAGYYILRKIMDSGLALGAEIKISGKITSQRARSQYFRVGVMRKSGFPAQEAVDKGVAQCIQKSGVLGVVVKIMRANFNRGDEVRIKTEDLEKAQKEFEAKRAKLEPKKEIDKKIEVEEVEEPISDEIKEIIEEVDETDVKEVSLESNEKEKKEVTLENKEEEKKEITLEPSEEGKK